MLESLANPLDSLWVRLQAALRSVAERASELGVLLVDYSKLGSAQAINKWFRCQFKRLGVNVLLASYQRRVSPVARFRLNGVCQERKLES